MQVIAFGHQKYVGKDTAARLLVTELKLQRVKAVDIGFADKVKHTAHLKYGYMGLKDRLYYEQHPEAKEVPLPGYHVTPRDIWIHEGNMSREIDDYCWIHNALHGISAQTVVVRDLRFRHEADYLVDVYGAFLIKLERDEAPVGNDPAEIDMLNYEGWHAKISNNGTMAELKGKILETLKR